MTKFKLYFVIVIFVSTVCHAESKESIRSFEADSLPPLSAISDPEAALRRAYEITGFQKIKAMLNSSTGTESAVLQPYVDSTFPFLAGQLNGRPCWHISLDSFYLAHGEIPGYTRPDEQAKHVDIYLDSTNGEFIKAVFTAYAKDSSGLPPEMPASVTAQRVMRGEKYNSLVGGKVPTNLVDVLKTPIREASDASQMIIYLVMYTCTIHPTASPSWVVIFRGVVPLDLPRPVPDYVITGDMSKVRGYHFGDSIVSAWPPKVTGKGGRDRIIYDALTGNFVRLCIDPFYPKGTWDKK